MSAADVLAIAGVALQQASRQEVGLPSDVFGHIGSTFGFGDELVDEVWIYGHVLRENVAICVGFSAGHVALVWKVNCAAPVLDALGLR